MAKEGKETKAQLQAAIGSGNVMALKDNICLLVPGRGWGYPATLTRVGLREGLFKDCSLCGIFDSCIKNDVLNVDQAKNLLSDLSTQLGVCLADKGRGTEVLSEVGLLLQFTKSLIEGLKESSPFIDLIQTLEDIFEFTNQTIKNGFLIFTKENIGDKSSQESLIEKLKQARTPQQCLDAASSPRLAASEATAERQADEEGSRRTSQLSKMVKSAESSRKKDFVAKAKSAKISDLQKLVLDLYKNPPSDLTDDFKKGLRGKLRQGIFPSNDTLYSILKASMGKKSTASTLDLIKDVGSQLHLLWKKTKELIDSSDTSSYAVYELYLFLKWLELLDKHLVSCSKNVVGSPRMFTNTLFQIYDFTKDNKSKDLLLFTAENMGADISSITSYILNVREELSDAVQCGQVAQVTNRFGKIRLRKGKEGSGERAEYENKVRVFRNVCDEFSKSVCRPFVEGSAPGFRCSKPGVAPFFESCFGYLDKVKKTSATKRWYKHAFKQATALDAYNKKKNTSQTSAVGSHTETTTLDKKQIKLWKSIWTTPFSMSGRATVKDPKIKDKFKTLKSDKLVTRESPVPV